MAKKGYKASDFINYVESVEEVIKTGNLKFDSWFSRDNGQLLSTIQLVTGTSGAGKTTLMINLLQWYVNYKSAFYSREMKMSRIMRQVRGLLTNTQAELCDKSSHTNFDEFMEFLNEEKPTVVVVDSMQAIAAQDYPEMNIDDASSIIRNTLTAWAQENNAVCFLIGHNTKDGEFAGKNTHMQMVDAHMVLEKDKKTGVRKMYWGQKNRNGEDKTLYYEINDGKILFFTEEEYADKLTPTDGPISLMKQVTQMIKSYEKSVKNDLFQQELAAGHKLYKEINKHNSIRYMADMIVLTTNLLNKYGIKQ